LELIEKCEPNFWRAVCSLYTRKK